MAIKVNLLPPEYRVSGPVSRALKLIRTLNVIFLAMFIIFTTGLGGYFILSTMELNALVEDENQLKLQITAQQTSEQQLVVLKDRVEKILSIRALANANLNLEKVIPLVEQNAGDSVLTELDVDARKVDLSMLIRSNSELTSFFDRMAGNEIFSTVLLSSFGFNPVSGYLVSFSML
jgi:hypothetical protein